MLKNSQILFKEFVGSPIEEKPMAVSKIPGFFRNNEFLVPSKNNLFLEGTQAIPVRNCDFSGTILKKMFLELFQLY